MSDSPPIPVVCDRCREQGLAGDGAFTAIRDLLTFDPVPRRAHVNGWTAELQRAFIAALAMTGSPRQAAAALGRWANGAEQLRKAKGARSFADAWDCALELYREREIFRIKDNLAALAERQEQRDEAILVQTHLRALPPNAFPRREEGPWDGDGHAHAHECPACAADPELAEGRRAAREHDESLRKIRRKLSMCRRLYLATIADDPDRRAAWDLLCGPADWDAARVLGEQPDEREGDPADVTPLREPRWQIPLRTGFAPELTDRGYDPHGDPLAQLQASVQGNDPRWRQSAPLPSAGEGGTRAPAREGEGCEE